MLRREFLALVGAATAIPGIAIAQPKVPRIGILVQGSPDPAPFLKEFGESLRDLGYVDGHNVTIELRNAGGDQARLSALAAELVALKVDMIVAWQTPAATAAKQATADIPIIISSGDPVGTGLVASLARPGGNVTGMSGATAELGGKNLELIQEILPSARRVAALANTPDPFHKPFLESIQAAGRQLGIEIVPIMVTAAEQIESAYTEMANARVQAVIIQPSLPRQRTATMGLKIRLPTFSADLSFPAAGGLMSYSADQSATYREIAVFVDKIIKGRKPADLPVQLPTKFRLVINLKTAAALGLTLPPTLLTRADQVIE